MNTWIEKLVFALLPVLISGIFFLFHTVLTLQDDMVTMKVEAQLAREELREQINAGAADLDKRVAILESKTK